MYPKWLILSCYGRGNKYGNRKLVFCSRSISLEHIVKTFIMIIIIDNEPSTHFTFVRTFCCLDLFNLKGVIFFLSISKFFSGRKSITKDMKVRRILHPKTVHSRAGYVWIFTFLSRNYFFFKFTFYKKLIPSIPYLYIFLNFSHHIFFYLIALESRNALSSTIASVINSL